MRFFNLLFLLLPLSGHAANTDFELAKHLHARVAFSANQDTISRVVGMPYDKAVDKLLHQDGTQTVTPLPSWTKEPFFKPRKKQSNEEKKAIRKKLRKQSWALKQWWIEEMIASPNPANEWMTLFWHNHFTSSFKKVKSPLLLYKQNQLLRENALGNFGLMLRAIAKDPAMLIYLDNRSNKKNAPNENFARELLELFTLGEGFYTEVDIKEAARAFSGWSIDKEAKYKYKAWAHDTGVKTFMGKTAKMSGDDIIDVILANPRTSVYLTEKLWLSLVNQDIESNTAKNEIERIAAILKNNNYAIKPWLRAMLLSSSFTAKQNRAVLIKSPLELIVGMYKQTGMPVKNKKSLPKLVKSMGQDLMDPPNVKGWAGGQAWITSQTLLVRQQFLSRAMRAMEMPENNMMSSMGMPGQMNSQMNGQMNSRTNAKNIEKLLLPMGPYQRHDMQSESDWLSTSLSIMLKPAYQLK